MAQLLSLRPARGGLWLILALLLGGGFSAHAALVVMQVAAQRAARVAPAATQPSAAMLLAPTVSATQAAPAAGTTGTTALPDLPIPANADLLAGDGSIKPAQPFALSGASALSRMRAQQCLTDAIYYEAASESDDGQRAVAQVVLNRVRHPAFPNSVCGVVYQGSERATGCQFSFACDGAMARVPSRAGWARASRIAAEALAGRVFAPVGEATHYHTYAVTPAWNRSLVMTAAIGAHFFHRWKGYWGTPAAFGQRYAGVEPLPGPHPRPDALAPLQLAGIPQVAPPGPSPFAKPAYRDSGTILASADPAISHLPESTILDRWKDTGRPLQ